MSDSQPCKLAVSAAEEAQAGLPVGFDPMTLITIIMALLPVLQGLFTGCTKPTPAPADVRDFVNQRYRNGQYGHGVLNHAIRAARQESRRKGSPLNKADAETVAVATLDKIRTADDATLQEAMSIQ